jgi:addiction module RelE/StbE family toxin
VKVRWTASAIADLVDIRRYIKERNPTAAAAVAANIRSRVALLRAQPLMGRVVRERAGVRELVVDNYVIVYVVRENEVEIERVWHGRQRFWG